MTNYKLKPILNGGFIKGTAAMFASNPQALLSFAVEACKIQFALVDSDQVDFTAIAKNIESQLDTSFGNGFKVSFHDADLDEDLEGVCDVADVAMSTVNLIISRYLNVDFPKQ